MSQPLFEWNEEYSVGNLEIDHQHQHLFYLINEFYESIKAGISDTELARSFREVVEDTRIHFDMEETLMRNNDYPGYNAHKAMHQELLKKIEVFDTRIQAGDKDVAADLLPFLIGDWLLHHIGSMDQLYVPYVADRYVD